MAYTFIKWSEFYNRGEVPVVVPLLVDPSKSREIRNCLKILMHKNWSAQFLSIGGWAFISYNILLSPGRVLASATDFLLLRGCRPTPTFCSESKVWTEEYNSALRSEYFTQKIKQQNSTRCKCNNNTKHILTVYITNIGADLSLCLYLLIRLRIGN